MPRSIQTADLLDELERLAAEKGRPPKQIEMSLQGAYSGSTYRDRFGSWNEALEAADLPTRERHGHTDIAREQLLAALRTFADNVGRTPTAAEMDEYGPFNSKTYASEFGDWTSALEEANLEPNVPRYSDDELLEKLRDLARDVDHTPSKGEMDRYGGPSSRTYIRRFGSWPEALRQASLIPNSGREQDTRENTATSSTDHWF